MNEAIKNYARAYAVVYALEGEGLEVPEKALENLRIAEEIVIELFGDK